MKTAIIATSLICTVALSACTQKQTKSETIDISWDNSLVMPSADGTTPNIGVAGAFAGIVNDNLVLTGGANFPDGFPWTGAKKVWHKDLYSLNLKTGEWKVVPDFLNQPLAYGFSIQLPDGIMMIGGNNSEHTVATVSMLMEKDGVWSLDTISFPDLPFPLSNGSGALVDGKIFLAGGVCDIHDDRSSHTFLMLDLSAPDKGWQQLRPWPGSPLGYCVGAAANGRFYLFSGRDFSPEQPLVMRTEGYCYDPTTDSWTILDNQFPFMAGTAVTYNGQILFLGGVEESLPTTPDHPGFSKVVRRYDPVTNLLDTVSVSPYPLTVTTTSFMLDDTLFMASGEELPGVRTPIILRGVVSTR